MPEIDVLMPVFNCEKYIEDTLRSIKNQTFSDYSLIIIDDGSSDRTGAIIRQFAETDKRIRYYRQDNAGIVAALNHGLKYCSAPFIARHDGDDISYPDRFKKELTYLKANPDCVAISSVARHIDENGQPTGHTTKVKDMTLVDCWSIPANEPYLMHPLLMVRREGILSISGYRNIYLSEDTDLYWRLSDHRKLYILADVLGDYRIHRDSLSSASLINGRQQAVWSQIAAISAQRRKEGRKDIDFSISYVQKIKRESHLSEIVDHAAVALEPHEIVWFRSAIAAKLLEMCYYRPYEPASSDIRFIRAAERNDPDITMRQGYNIFREATLSAAIRLILSGKIMDALSLLPPSRWGSLAGRVIFRACLPSRIKQKVKKILGR